MENNRIFEPYWNKQYIFFPVRPSKKILRKTKINFALPHPSSRYPWCTGLFLTLKIVQQVVLGINILHILIESCCRVGNWFDLRPKKTCKKWFCIWSWNSVGNMNTAESQQKNKKQFASKGSRPLVAGSCMDYTYIYT